MHLIACLHSISAQCCHLQKGCCYFGNFLETFEPLNDHLSQLVNVVRLLLSVSPGQEDHLPIGVQVHVELQLVLVGQQEVTDVHNLNLRTFLRMGDKCKVPQKKGEVP